MSYIPASSNAYGPDQTADWTQDLAFAGYCAQPADSTTIVHTLAANADWKECNKGTYRVVNEGPGLVSVVQDAADAGVFAPDSSAAVLLKPGETGLFQCKADGGFLYEVAARSEGINFPAATYTADYVQDVAFNLNPMDATAGDIEVTLAPSTDWKECNAGRIDFKGLAGTGNTYTLTLDAVDIANGATIEDYDGAAVETSFTFKGGDVTLICGPNGFCIV